MLEQLFTPEEVAKKLAVSPKTVRNWLRTGKLTGVKIGRLWRIREEDFKRFLASHSHFDEETVKLQKVYQKLGEC